MSGSVDRLVLQLAENAYNGDAQFSVTVDGVDVTPANNTVTQPFNNNAADGTPNTGPPTGVSQEFDIDVAKLANGGAHSVTVTFLNDAYGGSYSADRNLYVDDALVNGVHYSNATVSGTSYNWGSLQELRSTGDSGTYTIACYLRGTRIATADGAEIVVEELGIGDRVATPDGPMPVKWIGRRSYSGRFARGNKAVLPIQIRAGALADGVPRRDLWVSPKHALLLDGVLIPAEALVNGATVVQAREAEVVEYVHVELDRHAILFAEGALAESFVDDNSRGMFHNAHEHAALYPDARRADALYCAPRREDGEQVEAVRRRLALRADPAAPSGHEGFGALRGSVDLIDGNRVYGWAQHSERPEVPVCLEVLLGGAAVARILANRYRADLWHAGLGSGCHAFEAALPDAGHVHELQALRVRRVADGAELPNPSRGVAGSPGQRGPKRDHAA